MANDRNKGPGQQHGNDKAPGDHGRAGGGKSQAQSTDAGPSGSRQGHRSGRDAAGDS